MKNAVRLCYALSLALVTCACTPRARTYAEQPCPTDAEYNSAVKFLALGNGAIAQRDYGGADMYFSDGISVLGTNYYKPGEADALIIDDTHTANTTALLDDTRRDFRAAAKTRYGVLHSRIAIFVQFHSTSCLK